MTSRPRRTPVGAVMAVLNGIGSILILIMTVLICADIFSRSFLGRPVAGVAEMISLSIVAVVFFQIGHAVRTNALARTELVSGFLKRRSPRFEALLQSFYALVAVLVFAILAYGIWSKLIDAWISDEHVGVYGLFVAPVWPVFVVIVVGSAAAALQFCIHLCGHFMRFLTPTLRSDEPS